MRSEERTRLALEALRGATSAFLSALATAADEIRSYLAIRQSTLDGRAARLRAELGPFGERHVDAERLAALVLSEPEADPRALEAMGRALDTLTELAGRGEDLFLVQVAEGGSLQESIAAALGEIGRVFGAARVVYEARAGRHPLGGHVESLARLPFSRWTRGERRLAPPLVVTVRGSDLRAGSLSEFLDGRQKIVLVVEGDCPPAPLVRLVTPGTFVLQTHDGSGLDRLAGWGGPGVAALLPESAARFVHDPAAGAAPWDRLAITSMPEGAPRRAIGGLSALQQAEELDLLRALGTKPAGAPPATEPAGAAAPVAATASADPVESLAAWILRQADLSDLG